MKEVCGYRGLDGRFYMKQKDCEKADLNYKIESIERKLHNFSVHLDEYISYGRSLSVEDEMYYSRNRSNILKMVAEVILRDSDMFLKIINKKKDLEKELTELQKLRKNVWWLKVKWW